MTQAADAVLARLVGAVDAWWGAPVDSSTEELLALDDALDDARTAAAAYLQAQAESAG